MLRNKDMYLRSQILPEIDYMCKLVVIGFWGIDPILYCHPINF